MEFNKSMIIIMLAIFLLSIASVCASDANDTLVAGEDRAPLELSQADKITADDDGPVVEQTSNEDVIGEGEVGNFTELSGLISNSASKSTINLTKDYVRLLDEDYSSGIPIDKEITINGNGHTVDASEGPKIFSVSGSDVVLMNITFTNAHNPNLSGTGAGIYVTGNNFKVINSTFKDIAASGASAIYMRGANSEVRDCRFIDNVATRQYAAAIFLYGNNGKIINSTFTHNVAHTNSDQLYNDGGAIDVYGKNAIIDGCNFTDNIQTKTGGGAIYCGGTGGTLKNCNFINNSANQHGGAVSIVGNGWTLFNNYFENNTANSAGGGLYHNAEYGKLYNMTFVNNSAHMGGGAHLSFDYYRTTDSDYANTRLSDSRFINNHAIYGGGALNTISHVNVDNCEFINNSANNYGGALSIAFSNITNSRFINNTAPFGGAAFSYASGVTDSNFTDNHANFGNSVYILTKSYLNNNTGDDDAFSKPAVDCCEITGSPYVERMLETADGYYGFCCESYNFYPYAGAYDDAMDFIRNAINGQQVKEYLKILIYIFLDDFDELKQNGFSNHVWAFTDGEYWNSEDPVVQNVIGLYNSGFRVTDVNACKVLSNGTLMYINYSSMVTPSSQQNLFLFKFAYGEPLNQDFTTEALINETVFVGDTVGYRLSISNGGTAPVYDNWVADNEHSDGLILKSWRAESGNWTYNEQAGQWHLDVLQPGKSASVVLLFEVTSDGLLVNRAVSGLGDVNVTARDAGIEARNMNLTVGMKTVTPMVDVGSPAIFEITVRNNDDVDLKNVAVCESDYGSDLVYLDFVSKVGNWTHSIDKEGKHRFKLSEVLETGDSASFRVIFNATKCGNFSNVVAAVNNDAVVSNASSSLTVNKIMTQLLADAVTAAYNVNRGMVIALKDANGNPLGGVKVTVSLNGARTYLTDKDGQIKVSTRGLAPKAYTARIAFSGNANYLASSKDVKVTVKKAKPKLAAKNRKFKKSKKVKKYVVTLKDANKKPIKKAKLTIKIKKKTFKAKTNRKGKATFKIKKLTKKGTYRAKVTYKGSKFYTKVSKTVKITLR